MRIYVASDDPGLSYQLREQLLRLGQDCPSGHVVTLERAVPVLHSWHQSCILLKSSKANKTSD